MADFWSNYDKGKYSVGGKRKETGEVSFWDKYDGGAYSVGGDRAKTRQDVLPEPKRYEPYIPESLRGEGSQTDDANKTRKAAQSQYDDYLKTLRSSADIQRELNAVGDALKIEHKKRQTQVRDQIGNPSLETWVTGKVTSDPELDSRISRLQERHDALEKELKDNTLANYERNRLADDFAEASQYRSTDTGGAHVRLDLAGDAQITGYGNWRNEIINKNPDALAAMAGQSAGAQIATGSSIDLPSLTGQDLSWAQSMTDDQIAMYNYLQNTKGAQAADEYLDYIRSDVYAADRARIESEAQAFAGEHPVLASGKTVLAAPLKGISYVGQAIDRAADGKIDENAPYNRYSYEPTAMRNAVSQQVENRWGKAGSFLYGTGMSMADFLLIGAISGGVEWVSLGLMGTGAAADTVLEAKQRGLSDDQAFALGTVAGAAEILTEKVSVDRVFGAIRDRNGWVGKNVKEVILNLMGDTIAEGTEEAVSDVINCVADILVSGEKSEWETAIRTYREQNPGMTENDAFKYAFLDKMQEIGLDFLGGALSGFLMGGTASALNTGITAAQKNSERSRAIELARQARKAAPLTENELEFLSDTGDGETEFLADTPDTENGITLPTAEEDGGVTLPTAEEDLRREQIASAKTETERTGLQNGAKQEDIDSALRLSEATGRNIVFFSEEARNGTIDNGYVDADGTVHMNVKSKQKLPYFLGHEIVHTFEGTDAYADLQDYAKQSYVRNGKDWAKQRQKVVDVYTRNGVQLKGERAVDAEITADWLRDMIGGDERAITEICRDKPSLAKRIRDTLDDLLIGLGRLTGRQTYYEQQQIQNVVDYYDRQFKKAQAAVSEVKKIGPVAETPEEFLTRIEEMHAAGEMSDDDYAYAVSVAEEQMSTGMSGATTTVPDDGPEGKIPAWLKKKTEMLKRAVTTRNEAVDTARQEIVLPTAEETENRTVQETAEPEQAETASAESAAADTMETEPEAAEPVKTMAQEARESAEAAREETVQNENFREWFGNSAAVNDDGSPKIMYHGTSNGGFEFFDIYGKSGYGLFGMGAYFTENPDVAETYTKKGKGKNPMIYPAYLAINSPIDMDAPADIAAWKKALANADERFETGALNGLTTNEDVYRAVEEQVEGFEVPKYEGAEIMQSLLTGMGYDGITHMGGGRVNADDPRHRVYIIFDPEQAKSAVRNSGEYSRENGNIYHSISQVTADNAEEVLNENGVTPLSDGVAVKHSLSTWTETEKVNVRKALKEKGYETEDINKWIADMNTIAAIIGDDRARLDFEANPEQTFVKPNQEYRYTVDASTLCAKRLLYTGTFDAIQHALPNTVLNSDDVLAIMSMMKEAGYEAPCSVCYVESRRRNTGRFAQKWRDSYNGEYKPRIDELTTVDGRERLEREHPQAYSDFMSAMNRIGTNNPKITQTRTEYRGEIRKFSDALVEMLNEAGGLRLQSFSDFETPHLLDMMQVVADMSSKGLTSQAYTKIPAFARVFGGTGIKINLSLIADGDGFDTNGKLAFSAREGMDIDEAMEIRKKFGENVGTIIVGVNDKHILACMADDRIDFIIPFHKSGWGKAQIAQMGMEAYMDYTRFQNEKDITTGKKVKENIQPLDYWDFGVSGKENAETYLRLCAEQGRIPKFSRFLRDNGDGSWSLQPDGSTDGYWKLLTDYRMYDNNGNGAPQRQVRPDVDMDAAREILKNYKGGANSLPVARDIVERFVDEKRGSVQHSVSENEEENQNTGPIYELPAKAREKALRAEAELARRLDSALELGLAGPRGGSTPDLQTFRKDSVRPIVEAILRGEEPDTASLWTEYGGDLMRQHDFDEAFERVVPVLEQIRGFGERAARERAERDARNAELDAQIPTETEDLVKLAEAVKTARRNLATVRGRLLLTESDEEAVRQVLSGKMSEAEMAASHALSADSILEAVNAEREYRRAEAPWARYTQQLSQRRRTEADKHLENAAAWKDKSAGWKYDRETAERNIRDIVPDAAAADALVRDYFTPVHKSEAESTRFKNEYISRVKQLGLDMEVRGGNTASESYAVQFLGEAEDNIRYLTAQRNPKAVRDGHTLEEWQAEVAAFREQNAGLDWGKVNAGIKEFSKIYAELIEQMNGVLVENGYMPVNVRRGYFPHFNGGEDSIMAKFENLLGLKINTAALPTSINGLTAGFKPGKTWFGHAQERTGYQTIYDAVQGFENYIGGVADVIHQTDNLRNLRALATQVRYRTSDDQIREQIDAIMANDTIDEAQRQELIDQLKQKGKYQLSNFVAWLDEYTNLLANKKSKFDRGVEDLVGRKFYTFMKNLESRVAANMVTANVGSALTNFIPLNQAGAMIGDRNVLQGMYQTLKGYAADDGFRDRSDFLVNRRGVDPLYQNNKQKFGEFLSAPMNLIDNFTSESIVRAAYNRYRKQGLSAEMAMEQADELAAGIMADRSKGAQPVIFGSHNPLLKLFTQFQVEVNNEMSTVLKDIPKGFRDKAAWILLRYFLGAYLFNDVYEKIVGRRAALDPIGLINDAVGGFTGYKLPNAVDIAADLFGVGEADFGSEEERQDPYDALGGLLTGIGSELPFVGGALFEGGRIPMSSALPDWENVGKAILKEDWSGKKKATTLAREVGGKIGTYWLPPYGGGEAKKIVETATNLARGGRYTTDAEGNDILQYPYYTDTAGDAIGTGVKSLLFGGTSTEGGQEWVESGFKSLSKTQTAAYQKMTRAGADQRRAFEIAQMPAQTRAEKAEKYAAAAAAGATEADKASILGAVMADTDYLKYRAGTIYGGVDADTYTTWLRLQALYDADGSGSLTQEEAITAVEDFAMRYGMTNEQRAALYQQIKPEWKENPYDQAIGDSIREMIGK